jgi:hypothetical protein
MLTLIRLTLCAAPVAARPGSRAVVLILAGLLSLAVRADAQERPDPIHLKIIGGLAGVSRCTRHEAPFWPERVPALTQGRVIRPGALFDDIVRAGARRVQYAFAGFREALAAG